MLLSILWMLFVFALAGALLILLALREMRTMLLRPPRMTESKAKRVLARTGPGDVGIAEFEPMAFVVPAGERSREKQRKLTLAAWWMPHPEPSDRTCILVHGFADSKIGALAWAPTWRSLGFNLLAIDLRAHGESDGRFCAGGFFESEDLSRVIDLLREAKPAATTSMVLFGVSLGGAVVAGCAARRDDVQAVVLESVFAHYGAAARHHAALIAAPLRSLQPLAIRWAQRRSGADFDAAAPTELLRDIQSPVMLIHGGQDPFVPEPERAKLHQALLARGEARDVHWVVPESFHVLALSHDPDEYQRRLKEFLQSARGPTTISAGL